MSKVGSVKKLNNNGSTLIMAILAIAFVSLLASVILAAAVGNIVMKKIDTKSKSTFYTAEGVLDEIKTGVGKDSMTSMASAYEKVLANLVITDSAYEIDYMMSNEEANKLLQTLFMQNMVTKVTNGNVDFITITDKLEDNSSVTLENAKNYLSQYISKTELNYATVKSIESITIIKDYNGLQNQMIINNVVLNYKAQKGSDTYFADVTVDIDVAYPDMTVDFTSSKRLTDFKEFALIADEDIKVNATTENITAAINAGMYAGEYIEVTSGTGGMAHLTVGPNTDAAGMTVPSNIVTRKDIIIKGSESAADVAGNIAKFDVLTSNLWCTNLTFAARTTTLNQDISAGVEVNISSDSNSYIADDMNISGKNSTVTVGGNYYGYSYDGVNGEHAKSSAIIVDGAGSVLRLGSDSVTLKKLIIGGHSYISYKTNDVSDYMTGESLSFTGNQELYLIPSEYIGIGYDKSVANPMAPDAWDKLNAAAAADADISIVDVSGFFAYEDGLLAGTPYEVKKVNDLIYVYLNFKNNDARAKYIADVMAGEKAPELTEKLEKYTSSLLSENVSASGSVDIKEGGQIYTAGVLMETGGTNVNQQIGTSYEGNLGVDVLGVTSIDLSNRYLIMTQLLTDIPFEVNGSKYVVENVERTLEDLLQFYVTGNELVASATDNIVDWDLVQSKGYNDGNPTYTLQGTSHAIPLTKVAIDGDYTIPDNVLGGIVVASGDVTVTHDFTGLIIAKGNILIKGNATVTTNEDLVEQLLTFEFTFNEAENEEAVPFKNYFYAYKSSGDDGSEDIKIESLGYDDMVSLNNWRKYDDSANAGQ